MWPDTRHAPTAEAADYTPQCALARGTGGQPGALQPTARAERAGGRYRLLAQHCMHGLRVRPDEGGDVADVRRGHVHRGVHEQRQPDALVAGA